MKKLYTIFLSFGITLAVSAQTFTYAGFSNSLTSILNVKVANTSSFNTALNSMTGTGVVWNAAGLTQQTGTPIIHYSYASPASTPYASLFPSSNYSQYDPALTAYLNYDYYGINSTTFENWGEYSPSGAHEIYQDADKRLIFPFDYGQSFSDSYSKTNYSNATTVSSIQTGNRTVTFAGYGTLILPQGTFTNVAMIAEMRTNSLGPNSTEYTWWDIAHGKKLLYYSENNGSTNVAYNADSPLSSTQFINEDSVSIFPNPSNGKFTINTQNDFEISSVEIYNALGQTIYKNDHKQSFYDIDVANLAKGVCFVKMTNSEKTSIKKIVIK